MDIGCSPGSWMQYAAAKLQLNSKFKIQNSKSNKEESVVIGFDIKPSTIEIPGVHWYVQDITDTDAVRSIISKHGIEKFDAIISDMAPNTIGFRDIDAMRSIELLRTTLPLYQQFLKNG